MNQIINEKKFIENTLGVPYANLSQSYLRAQTSLVGNFSDIKFNLQRNKVGSPLVTEQLLELNDQFVITHFTIAGLAVIGTQTPSALDQAKANLLTYSDPAILTGDALNLAAMWNASLAFNIDRRDYLPSFPMRAFHRIPRTQTGQNLDATGGSAATFENNTGKNSFDNGLFGFYPCEPTVIDARQTLDVVVNLGQSVDFNNSSDYVAAVFEARGYLIVNSKD